MSRLEKLLNLIKTGAPAAIELVDVLMGIIGRFKGGTSLAFDANEDEAEKLRSFGLNPTEVYEACRENAD